MSRAHFGWPSRNSFSWLGNPPEGQKKAREDAADEWAKREREKFVSTNELFNDFADKMALNYDIDDLKAVRDRQLDNAFDPGAVDSRGIPTERALPPYSPNGFPLDKESKSWKNPDTESASERQVGGNHYKDMAIEPSEFIHRNGIGWLEGNAIKYTCRHAMKGGAQDIDKAIHYLELLKEWQYGHGKK